MNRLLALAAFLCLGLLATAAPDPEAFNAAVGLYQQRKPLEAQHAFEALAAANPANADIQFYLGRLALQRDDHQQAVAHLEQAVALAPGESRFHQRLGDAYGRAAQKAGFFSKLTLAGKCRASRGRMAVAGLYVVEKKFALAFAEFETALQANPDDYAALFQLGRLAAISGLRSDAGLAALRTCLDRPPPEGQPSHAAAHWRIGNILEKQGDKPGARAAYEAALRADPKFVYASESLKLLK
ncbi:MAG: tetratricopeptide repeat protein [Opitutae bacterium]|nr:tetratricopeptide repeat protein [Opitutae bacterium]